MEKQPLYQEIATEVLHLKQLDLNASTIARRLNVGYKTVVKAIKCIYKFNNLNQC